MKKPKHEIVWEASRPTSNEKAHITKKGVTVIKLAKNFLIVKK